MIKVGVIGCVGRMGQAISKEIMQHEETSLYGGAVEPGSSFIGHEFFEGAGVKATDDIESLMVECDAIIDFTTPETTLHCAKLAALHRTIMVSGTTGLTNAQFEHLQLHAKETPIIWASNMSIGVNMLFALVEQTAKILDESYDIEIVEMHHRHKVDAPSGTALSLGEAAAVGRDISLDSVACQARSGNVGARPKGEIGFATLRGGDVVGDHTVIFASDGERVELTHKASDRSIFAKGAVRACIWAKDKPAGFYSMRDVVAIDR